MNFSNPFFPRHAFLFKGGGSAPAVVAPPEPVAPPPPATATPAAPIFAPTAPAASQSAPEVTQARIDARKQAAKRKGLNSTILAGADAVAGSSTTGGSGGNKNTLLGGG